MLVIFSLCLSIMNFKLKWGVWPELIDVVMACTLLALFALPSALSDLLHLGVQSGWGFMVFLAVYWSIVVGTLCLLIRTKNTGYLIVLAILILLSSIRWQIISTGMMGI